MNLAIEEAHHKGMKGQLVHAKKDYEAVVADFEQLDGDHYLDTLTAQMNLGILLSERSHSARELKKAEYLLRQAVEGFEQAPHVGPRHERTLTAKLNLAVVLTKHKDTTEQAVKLFRTVVESFMETLGAQTAALPCQSPTLQLTLGHHRC